MLFANLFPEFKIVFLWPELGGVLILVRVVDGPIERDEHAGFEAEGLQDLFVILGIDLQVESSDAELMTSIGLHDAIAVLDQGEQVAETVDAGRIVVEETEAL